MKGKKKGISSILGALIFLQILLISLLLVIHVINNETNITLKSVQRFQAFSENAPIEEEIENNITYLYSTTPFVITHIIYPNGEIVNTSIMVNGRYPVSQVLNGFPWAIIVTNKGTWYNVTPLGDSNYNSGLIIFPYYHDYGQPLDPSVLDVTQYPNWNVLEGIAFSSALSLVPVNVTIGDPVTYHWALTDSVLVVYPLSSDGWINITYSGDAEGQQIDAGPPSSSGPYFEYCINATLGIYIPVEVNVTLEIFKSFVYPNLNYKVNTSAYEYLYVYVRDDEFLNMTAWFNGFVDNNTSIIPIIGTQRGSPSDLPLAWFQPYLPSYPIPNTLPHLIDNVSILPPPLSGNYSPPDIDLPIETGHTKFSVFQIDINLHEGIMLNYGYDPDNNSWILLSELTFNYNNPQLYSKANILFPEIPACLLNVNNIQYLTMYPIYIAIPQGTNVLQVSLS